MTIVSQTFDYVVGVDTHARTHTYCVIEAPTGVVLTTHSFATTPKALIRAITWIRRHTAGKQTLAAVEGTGCYGAKLARVLAAEGYQVCDIRPAKRTTRRTRGKSDPIDAEAAARCALALDTSELAQVRADGARAGLRVLIAARNRFNRQRTANINALTMLVRCFELGIDARKALTPAQITRIANWRARKGESIDLAYARADASGLAKTIRTQERELASNEKQLTTLVDLLAPGLTDQVGVGPISAARILVAYSHHGRFNSETGFAKLAGVSPLPASSGNTIRHRLNRGGDRQLNQALDTIALVRMAMHPESIAYKVKRTKEGLSDKEIKRVLKRYLARDIYKFLQQFEALNP